MATPRRPAEPSREPCLFVLRLWPEDVGGGRTDWRGSIRHLPTGEARYFRDWPTMEAFVDGVLGGGCEAVPPPKRKPPPRSRGGGRS